MKDMTGNWIVAGNLVCVSMPVPMQILEDIKAALLFAQLAADDKYPKQRSSSKWFAEYTKALTLLKWGGVESESHSVEVDDEDVVNIGSIVDQFLLSGMGSEYADYVRQALACLAAPPAPPAQTLFRGFALVGPLVDEQERHPPATETTVALLVTVLKPGAIVECLWVAFSAEGQLTEDFVHQPITGSHLRGPLEVRVFQRQWNAARYDTVRAKVERYIAGKKADMIMPLECSGEPAQD